MLIEFHVIQDHGPSNMNRDKEGRPKTAFYAGSLRLRISSQCCKRTLRQPRQAGREDTEGVFERTVGRSHFGIRTKLLPQLIFDALRDTDLPEQYHHGVRSFFERVGQKSDDDKASKRKDGKKKDGPKRGRTKQAIYFDPMAAKALAKAMFQAFQEKHTSGESKGKLVYPAVFEAFLDPKVLFATEVETLLEIAEVDESDRKKITKAAIRFVNEKLPEAFQIIADASGDVSKDQDDGDQSEGDDSNEPEKADLNDPDLPERFVAIAIVLLSLVEECRISKAKFADLFKAPASDDETYKVRVPAQYTKQRAKLLKALGETYSHRAADIALFGRMTTSDAFQDVEAACQVADAMSTHPVDIETDYFTTVDDLDTGIAAAHLGESKFASAVFYHNLVVDFDELLRNLGATIPKGKEDDPALQVIAAEAGEIAKKSIEGLLRAVMQNVPSGKINSHAHNQQPSLILVEVKQKKLATNYLTAFHDPARRGEREDGSIRTCLADSSHKLLAFARYRDRKMKSEGTQRFLFIYDQETEDAVARMRVIEGLKEADGKPLTDGNFFKNSSLKTCDDFDSFVAAVNDAVSAGRAK